MPESRNQTRERPRRRLPRPVTPERLEHAALTYLVRYAAPSEHLRRLLLTKVERSAQVHGTDREAGAAAVERIVARLVAKGLLDDAAYAEASARGLHRRGASARGIRHRLLVKGVAPDLVERSLARLGDRLADPELAAALAYARRRRLGPHRPAAARDAARTRDLAALSRQGFAYQVASRVIDAEDLEDLEREAATERPE